MLLLATPRLSCISMFINTFLLGIEFQHIQYFQCNECGHIRVVAGYIKFAQAPTWILMHQKLLMWVHSLTNLHDPSAGPQTARWPMITFACLMGLNLTYIKAWRLIHNCNICGLWSCQMIFLPGCWPLVLTTRKNPYRNKSCVYDLVELILNQVNNFQIFVFKLHFPSSTIILHDTCCS